MAQAETPPPKKWLTVPEVATVLRCSATSVYRRVWDGQLPARRIGETGPLRFQPADVENLLRPAKPSNEDTP